MKKKSFLQSRTWFCIQIAVVVLLFAVMWRLKGDEFASAFRQFELKWLGAAFVVYFVSLILTFLRWQILVKALGLPFTMFDAIRLGFLGAVTSLFLPGSITGDGVKALYMCTEQSQKATAIATIVVDRIIGLYALLALTSVIGVVFWQEVNRFPQLVLIVYFVWSVTVVAALAVVSMFLFRADPFIAWIEKLRFVGKPVAALTRALQRYKRQPGPIAATVALGMIGHVGFVMTFQICARAVDQNPPPWELLYIIIPAFMVAGSVPLTPMGGIGVGEAMLGGLFQMIGAPFAMGVSVSLAQRVVAWSSAAVGLIWYIPLAQELRRRQAQAAAEMIEEFETPVPDEAKPPEPKPPAETK